MVRDIAGTYAYTSTYTQQTDDTTSAGTGNYGGSWASFMMGLPSGISAVTNTDQAYGNPYFGAYVEDGWRITNKLTLNFGLRLEYELGPTDRYNRLIGPFDPNATLPITAGAQAAYALNPIPELPASQLKVLGGATFPGVGGANRRLWSNSFNWLPRLFASTAATLVGILVLVGWLFDSEMLKSALAWAIRWMLAASPSPDRVTVSSRVPFAACWPRSPAQMTTSKTP